MNSFELLTAFSLMLVLTGFFVSSTKITRHYAVESLEHIDSRLEAEKCAFLIDSFYAIGGGKFESLELFCHEENGLIVSEKNNAKKSTQTIALEKKVTGTAFGTAIEVTVREHYG